MSSIPATAITNEIRVVKVVSRVEERMIVDRTKECASSNNEKREQNIKTTSEFQADRKDKR